MLDHEDGFRCHEYLRYTRHCPHCGRGLTLDIEMEDRGFIHYAAYVYLSTVKHHKENFENTKAKLDLVGAVYEVIETPKFEDSLSIYVEIGYYERKLKPFRLAQITRIAELLADRAFEMAMPQLDGEVAQLERPAPEGLAAGSIPALSETP